MNSITAKPLAGQVEKNGNSVPAQKMLYSATGTFCRMKRLAPSLYLLLPRWLRVVFRPVVPILPRRPASGGSFGAVAAVAAFAERSSPLLGFFGLEVRLKNFSRDAKILRSDLVERRQEGVEARDELRVVAEKHNGLFDNDLLRFFPV